VTQTAAPPPESTRSPDLVLSEISKTFGGVVALRSASLIARPGEVHGLIGENGAGKSTLVKILSGAVTPDGGTVAFAGADLSLGTPTAARQAGIATAFQELSLVPDWDVATNLVYGRNGAGAGRLRPRPSRRKAGAIMASFGVTSIDPRKPVRELRLAERQMLEIMHALTMAPRILVLDEPTSALTPDQVWWFFEQVRSFLTEDRIVLFISHRLEEIESLCHRVTVLRDGRDVGTGPLAEMPERRLVELMLGETSERALTGESQDVQRTKEAPVVVALERFSSQPELHEIDLEIREGEIVGVAGLEGQGQLELFLALYGARRSSGTATVRDKPIHGRSPSAAIRDGVGLVPHDRGLALCLPLSIRDNVTLGTLRRISRAGIISREKEARLVSRALSTLRVRARSTRQLVETLSGGNQQKVLLGRVLTSQPRLLLMYDATRGVDVGTKAEIFHLMRQQAEAGVAILYYSTDAAELTAMCDRVVVLHDGRIRAQLSGADLTQERIIAAAIGGGRGG